MDAFTFCRNDAQKELEHKNSEKLSVRNCCERKGFSASKKKAKPNMTEEKWISKVVMHLAVLLLIGIFSDVSAVSGHHYRGGSISWKPASNYTADNKQISFTFELAWNRSRIHCNNNTISSGDLIGGYGQRWVCTSGCHGPVGTTAIQCHHFDESDDYVTGSNTFNYVFKSDGPFTITFMRCCWIVTKMTNDRSDWGLTTKIVLGTRNDTGKVNSAPIVRTPLFIRIPPGIPKNIDLNIVDDDNDVTECRLGQHRGECGRACDVNSEFVFDKTNCRIIYKPTTNETGLFPFSLVIEDFSRGNAPVKMGNQTLPSREPLSSIPFQFIVQVGKLNRTKKNCSQAKPDISLSINSDNTRVILVDQTFQLTVEAETCDQIQQVSEFEILGPQGITKSNIVTSEKRKYQIMLSWRPTNRQLGLHQFCAVATQTNGIKSEEKCFAVYVETGVSYCRGTGGNQYITFDNKGYSFNGDCRYQLVETTFYPPSVRGLSLQPFSISVMNDVDSNSGRTSVNTLFVTIAGNDIELHRFKRLYVNKARVYPPVRLPGVKFDLSGRFIVMTADSNLTLRYDGSSTYVIGLPRRYSNMVEGLCGNFNSNSTDELMSSNTVEKVVITPSQLAEQFQVQSSKRCQKEPSRDISQQCNERQRIAAQNSCGVINKQDGCFSACHDVVDPRQFYQNCINALCSSTYTNSILEAQVGAYADACQVAGVMICDWRKIIGSALECSPNSHYNACAPSVPRTCMNINETIELSNCLEGCVCDNGYVLSGDNCVPQISCGCFVKGSYRRPGFTFRSSDCVHECTCTRANKTLCTVAPPCGANERCGVLNNGFRGCVARIPASATCKVFGDPHYVTFDGAAFDSMSTCAHVLVRTRADSPLTPFTVIGVNEEPRANQTISHVNEVYIRVDGRYNANISLLQGRAIRMNGDIVYPGSTFGGIQFRMTTIFVVVTFDFGLVVRWDGVDRLRISAWEPLKGQVEGLCGNYDGDRSNEYVASDGGGLTTNEVDFIKSWRIVGKKFDGGYYPEPPQNQTERCINEGFTGEDIQVCVSSLPPPPPSCRERQVSMTSPCDSRPPSRLAVYQRQCNILIDAEGPFAPCHSLFDPHAMYANCLFDMCAYDGNATFMERIISSYDFDCRESKLLPPVWKNRTDQIICGEYSEYSSCISQCQPSCDDPDGRKCQENKDLGDFCEEGCKCRDGHVRSVEGCIPKSECGCIINGMYQMKGFTYRTSNCTQLCQCMGDGDVTCKATKPCLINLVCKEDNRGYQRCAGRLRRRATCKAITDPHYTTFDGTSYDSMGTCAYVMVRNRAGTSAPNFQVIAVNEDPLPGKNISHVREVYVLFGDNQTMRFMQGPRVTLGGVEILPGTERDGFVVRLSGAFVVVEFNFRLVVKWTGKDRLRITVWQPLRNMVEGLCGDFDDDRSNDFQTSWGDVTPDLATFITSWEVPSYSKEGCYLPPPQNLTQLCGTQENLALYGKQCSVLTNPDGPFATCHEDVPPWPAYRDCLYDLCAYNGSSEQKDRVFSSYLSDCESALKKPNDTWRIQADLPVVCPESMHYNSSAPSCRPSCTDPDGEKCRNSDNIDSVITEVKCRADDVFAGCECDDGFVLSGMTCVPIEECGCLVNGRYHPKGFVERSSDCKEECKCVGGNNMTCYAAPSCPPRSKCKKDRDGHRRCVVRLRRRATCKAVTDPHYMTFDGTRFDAMGACSYIMVRSKSNATVPEFSVVAVNEQPNPNRAVSHVREVIVHYQNNTMKFLQGKNITLNGVRLNAGYNKDGVEIRMSGRYILADWKWGMVVKWDGEDRLRVLVWSPLRYNVEGVCGDFDDNPNNDMVSPSGETYPNAESFVNNWIVEGYGAEGCLEESQNFNPPNPTCDDQEVLNLYRNVCSVLIDQNGPMRECHNVIEAETAFQACVFDQCSYDGDARMKDRLISSYLDTCLEIDEENRDDNDTDRLTPPSWRTVANLSDPDCPPNSHFNNCMTQCQPTCADRNASICLSNPRLGNVCVEGCEADDGFIRSGSGFVVPNQCGCVVDGEYYLNTESFHAKDCDELCQCNSGKVSCTKFGCNRYQECRANKDGKLSCQPFRTVTCESQGNGHFLTLDKRSYTFNGVCQYVFAMPTEDPVLWRVLVDTEMTATNNTRIRSVTYINLPANVTVTIVFTRSGHSVKMEVNKVEIENTWSMIHNEDNVTIQRLGRFAVLTTATGIKMEFDGDQLVLSLPIYMRGKISGLCGNFNESPDDDIISIGNNSKESIEKFASTYQTKQCERPPLVSKCTRQLYLSGKSYANCGVIRNVTGPLRLCNRVISPSITRRHFDDCAEDYCASAGNRKVLEKSIRSYIYQCQTRGVRICDWREKTGFETSCPPNMHYEGCASSCQDKCGESPTTEDCPLIESCVCNSGYILQDGVCVPNADCDCDINGVSWPYGETYTSPNCNQVCTCYGNAASECYNKQPCRINQICQREGSSDYSCVKKPQLRPTCSVLSGRHVKTFDGSRFDLNTPCTYTMVRSINNTKMSAFEVIVSFETSQILPVPRVADIRVHFDRKNHTMIITPNLTVLIDGKKISSGMQIHGVSTQFIAKEIVITFPVGLVIRWNGNGSLRIDAWRQLVDQVEGLCGNFDDNAENDVTNGFMVFLNMWLANSSLSNGSRCNSQIIPPQSLCDLENSKSRCNVVIDKQGPFNKCHDLLSPQPYYNDCVSDSCSASALSRNFSESAENQVFAAYNRDCAIEGGNSVDWRNLTGSTIECPAHSTFVTCSSQCQATCQDRDASRCHGNDLLGDDCLEDCQCDEGFVKDQSQCILVENCRCMIPGGGYIDANSAQYMDDCTKLCECKGGTLTCSNTSCYSDQYCGVREGAYGCHWFDECEYDNGGCSHTCEYVKNKPICSCPTGYFLNQDNKTCNESKEEIIASCDNKETEESRQARWREATFGEWMTKLQKYVETFNSGFKNSGEISTICGPRWTEWFDRDNSGGTGDDESLNLLQLEFPKRICKSPVAIEARLKDGRPATLSGNNVTLSPDVGLQCYNKNQPKGLRCADFEVRFLCLDTLV